MSGTRRKLNQLDRKIDKIGNDNQKLTERIRSLEGRMEKNEKRASMLQDNAIINDLQKERFPGSGKYMYTYADLADKYNTNKNVIYEVALSNGLTRRNKETS